MQEMRNKLKITNDFLNNKLEMTEGDSYFWGKINTEKKTFLIPKWSLLKNNTIYILH
jgi:hypothetical protein